MVEIRITLQGLLDGPLGFMGYFLMTNSPL